MKIDHVSKVSFLLRCKLNQLAKEVEKQTHQTEKLQLTIAFVSPTEIKNLNNLHRSKDAVTDVLSFPFLNIEAGEVVSAEKFFAEVDPLSKRINLGDIAICTERAKEQAAEFGHSIKREVCFLAVHGMLHLLGFDHMNKEDEQKMNALAQSVLAAKGVKR